MSQMTEFGTKKHRSASITGVMMARRRRIRNRFRGTDQKVTFVSSIINFSLLNQRSQCCMNSITELWSFILDTIDLKEKWKHENISKFREIKIHFCKQIKKGKQRHSGFTTYQAWPVLMYCINNGIHVSHLSTLFKSEIYINESNFTMRFWYLSDTTWLLHFLKYYQSIHYWDFAKIENESVSGISEKHIPT